MRVVYASRTGNVENIISRLNVSNPLKIEDGSETINENYILFTYTDGYGDTPQEVEEFLSNNSNYLKGVIASGDTSYGEAFCKSGDNISEQYNVPFLYKVENAGTQDDILSIRKILSDRA